MFDQNNPQYLWVSPESLEGDGTYSRPYHSIELALKRVEPGNTIILKNGIYDEDVTIQISGTITKPIVITCDDNAKVEILESCWFFYDTSDIIISGLTFKNAPFGAISVIGTCERNRFDSLQFFDCGSSKKAACTMYFGGAGAKCNLVENCTFIRSSKNQKNSNSDNSLIALMVAEGDHSSAQPIKHHIFRKNKFVNYDFGILIGSHDSSESLTGHIVEYNTIENCRNGILVKCGDTHIRGNLLKDCTLNSIKISAGSSSIVENNRIEKSLSGIEINGPGHSIVNNCLINCKEHAISVKNKYNTESEAASNLFIETNTIIFNTQKDSSDNSKSSGIKIEPGTTSIIRNNLICGSCIPCLIAPSNSVKSEFVNSPAQFVISQNAASIENELLDGFTSIGIQFKNMEENIWENESGFGAQGWVLRPECFDPDIDKIDGEIDYVEASMYEDDDGNPSLPGEIDQEDLMSTFFSDLDDKETQNELYD